MPIDSGQPAPDFELPSLDGRQQSRGDLHTSGPVVVSFVKAGCPTCRFSLPLLDAMHEALGRPRHGVVVVAQESPGEGARMAEELELSLPILLDERPFPASRSYEVNFVPTTFLIDEGGLVERVSESFSGPDFERFYQRLAESLGSPPKPFHGPEPLPAFRPG